MIFNVTNHTNYGELRSVTSYLHTQIKQGCSKNVFSTCFNMSCNNNPTHEDKWGVVRTLAMIKCS